MRERLKEFVWVVCAVPSVVYGVAIAFSDIARSKIRKWFLHV